MQNLDVLVRLEQLLDKRQLGFVSYVEHELVLGCADLNGQHSIVDKGEACRLSIDLQNLVLRQVFVGTLLCRVH